MSSGSGSVYLQSVTFELSCCHHAGNPATLFLWLPTEVFTHMAFEGQDGGAGAFVPFTWHNLPFGPPHSVTISAAKYGLVEMGHFHAIPEVVAVAADRLVAIVRVGTDSSVVVRDLANGALSTTSASELRAPPALLDATIARCSLSCRRQKPSGNVLGAAKQSLRI